jgi:hypothetical protein
MLPRSEAWQEAYAGWVFIELGADHARLLAAGAKCRQDAAAVAAGRDPGGQVGDREWWAAELSRAADLCEQAAQMMERAGAVDDDKVRRQLLAACEYEASMNSLGNVIPSFAEAAAGKLRRGPARD